MPTACQWRNGAAECAVAQAKAVLSKMVSQHELLTYVELETALLQVASLLNLRPVSARVFEDGEFHAICPADLLLGKISGYDNKMKENWGEGRELGEISVRLAKVNQFVNVWWKKWLGVAFGLLCPRRTWKQEHRQMQVGDIVLLKEEKKLGKDKFRLGKVLETLPDSDSVVRTVEVGVRTHRRREIPTTCKLPLERIRTAVQKLVVILPAEEKWNSDMLDLSTSDLT